MLNSDRFQNRGPGKGCNHGHFQSLVPSPPVTPQSLKGLRGVDPSGSTWVSRSLGGGVLEILNLKGCWAVDLPKVSWPSGLYSLI